MNTEPVAWSGALVAFVTAVLALLIGFEVVDWTQEQVGLILGALTAAIALGTALVRSKVTPSP